MASSTLLLLKLIIDLLTYLPFWLLLTLYWLHYKLFIDLLTYLPFWLLIDFVLTSLQTIYWLIDLLTFLVSNPALKTPFFNHFWRVLPRGTLEFLPLQKGFENPSLLADKGPTFRPPAPLKTTPHHWSFSQPTNVLQILLHYNFVNKTYFN
jgi:hypothetical protein